LELRFGQPSDERPILSGQRRLRRRCGHLLRVQGRDLDSMLVAVRRVAARFPLPSDAYLWVPSLTRRGFGTVVGVRQD
jgi:hypothetical protein